MTFATGATYKVQFGVWIVYRDRGSLWLSYLHLL